MSRRVGDKFIVEPEGHDTCTSCGTVAELRPYGKNGARICLECGMADLETTQKMFKAATQGATIVYMETEMPFEEN